MAFYYKPKSPQEILTEGQGLIAESFSKFACNGSAAFTSGDLRASLIPLRAGQVVTNIHVGVAATAASSVTTIKAALYSKVGATSVRLAVSANSTSALNNTQSIATIAMSTPYTVPADDVYYAGILVVATTMPTLLRINSNSPFHLAAGSGKPMSVVLSSQTDCTDPANLANGTALAYWFGVS